MRIWHWIRTAVNRQPLFTLFASLLMLEQLAVAYYFTGRIQLPPNTIFALVGQSLFLFAWAFLLTGRKRALALAAVNVAVGFVMLTDIFYFRQFADLPSVGSLKHAGLMGDVDGMDGIVGGLLQPGDALLFWALPLLAFVAWRKPAWLSSGQFSVKRAATLTAIGFVLCAAVIGTTNQLRKPFGGHTKVSLRIGPIGYHAYDIGFHLTRELRRSFAPVEEQLETARGYFVQRGVAAPSAEFGSIAKGKNVIYVQLESWQRFPLFRTLNGREITPNLNRLAKESVYFPNFFAQIQQGTTSDAELLAQCSIYPSRTGSVYYDHPASDLRCLPEVLREHGYRTIAMHGNRPDFWNRAAMYPTVGIDRFYDVRDFEMADPIGMGVPDIEFFRQAVAKLEQERKPFYSLLVSLTSHSPFNYPGLPDSGFDHGAFADTRIAHYFDSVHYTDRAIGVLMEELERSGLLDETILVVYGDHLGVGLDSSNVGDYLGIGENDPVARFELERGVPGMIRLPKGEHAGERHVAAGQLDIAPTVARLLGIPLAGTAFLGRDLLSDEAGFVALANGSATDGELLALSDDGGYGKGGCYLRATREEVDGERCRDLRARAERELLISWDMLDSDLVAKVAQARSGNSVAAKTTTSVH